MEIYSGREESKGAKVTFIVYLDLSKTSYRYFIEHPNVTAGELVERILSRYIEQGYVKEKRKEFSLYLINSRYIESQTKSSKTKTVFSMDDESNFENTIDSANKFPTVLKRKLNYRDKPIEILQRTNRKMKHKDPALFKWDLYFLSHSGSSISKRNIISSAIHKEGDIFDQLFSNITDKKFFHRKGNCLLRAEKGEEFREVTLILTGDHLYYVNNSADDSLNLILLSEASLNSNHEKSYSFEVRSNNRRFVIACKSQHDMDNWISEIYAQIEHTKCKHQINDLESRIQFLAKDASKDEAANPSRKQFLTYLESLDPQHGSLLQENINAIHLYKSYNMELQNLTRAIQNGTEEVNEATTMKENELLAKVESQATEIIWELFNGLKRAKWVIKDQNFVEDEKPKDDDKAEEEVKEPEKENGSLDAGLNTMPVRQMRRKQYGMKKDLNYIDKEAIVVDHSLKMTEYKTIAQPLQILILWPIRIFLQIHEKFVRMK